MLLICSNTMHRYAGDVEAATERGLTRVGLLGTRPLMEADHYRGRMEERWGLSALIPGEDERETINQVIFGELCRGIVREPSRDLFLKIIDGLADRGPRASSWAARRFPCSSERATVPCHSSTP